jgi:hypothetical protein
MAAAIRSRPAVLIPALSMLALLITDLPPVHRLNVIESRQAD